METISRLDGRSAGILASTFRLNLNEQQKTPARMKVLQLLRQFPRNPIRNSTIHPVQPSDKKMICLFNNDKLVLPRQQRHHLAHFVHRPINIIGPVNEELRLRTLRQKRKIRAIYWSPKPDQSSHSIILATSPQPNPAPETKSRHKQRNVWKFASEKIQSSTRVATLAISAIVLAFAQSSSAKIEPQNRKPKRVQRFRRLIYDFVVHRSAKERMRVANHRSQRRRARAGTPQNSLKLPGRTSEKQFARLV
jgi:hypothetical protein